MVNEIVRVHGKDPRAGTFLISKGFGREHKEVIRLINKYKDRFLRLEDNKAFLDRFIIQKVSAKTAGRPVEEYLLNEQQTIFLGTLFRNSSDLVLDFKERLAGDFVKIKNKLAGIEKTKQSEPYKITRIASKIIRKKTTDEMKRFVEYAKSQGSGSPDRYYSNITKMMNGLLFIVEGKFKNLRDVMTIHQLMTVSSAEQIIDKGLRSGMDNQVFYKDIYKDVKKRVMTFAELHGQSEVIEECLKLENKSKEQSNPWKY